ncbi:MAG TPA: aminotransferase class V-fold PLP-dependent enzyme, partial [Acidobacteriaceae bacterium]
TFRQDSATSFGDFDYTRSGNPTRAVLETQLALLESGTRAFCFSTGLAAITAVTRLLKPGEQILACDDLYGGTYRLFSRILANRGITVQYVDFTDESALKAAFTPAVKLVYLESPTNPLLQILDLQKVASLAHQYGARVCVDNSTMSPYLQRPLELGCDIVIHSATKFLCGHSDVMAGAVIVKDAALADDLYLIQNGEGGGLAPFDSFLVLRGLKTLALRQNQQQANATAIAHYLQQHPSVTEVYFPALAPPEAAAIHKRQASGPGSVLSFRTGDPELSRRVVESCKLHTITVSFGGVNSTISLPNYMSHASIPDHLRSQKQIPRDLVRISVGIEAVDDLTADLDQAFAGG